RVQNLLTVLKVGLVVGLVFAGFALGQGSGAHFSQGEAFGFDFGGWKTLGLSLMWIMFAYSGWNASAYIGSEIKNPARNLPLSLLLGTAGVAVMYFGLNLYYVYAVPPGDMSGVISIGGLAVGNSFGPSYETVLSVMISFALFSSLSAFIILGPRVYYSMARDGYFFRFAAFVHPRFGVPSTSIILQGSIAVLMVLLGTYDQILTYMGFSLGIFPLLAVVGIFRLRRRNPEGVRMPGFPLVPAIYLLAGGTILTLALFQRPLESGIAILMVLIGIPVYFAFTGGKGSLDGTGHSPRGK
ncbi:MAG: amino acid permease, partial [Acidobacteria bacterium]|nr:amino acid permease [Acidobacteriota bacterium]